MIKGRPLTFDREEVLGKALELFWVRGYEGLGMSELLKGMGIPRQSFYNTFGSKEDVFLEAFELYISQMRATFTGIFAKSSSPLEGLRHLFDFIEEMAESGSCAGCLVGNTLAEFGNQNDKIAKVVNDAMKGKEDMLVGAFKAAIDSGELKTAHSPKELAGIMMAMNQGMALMSKSGKDKEQMKALVRTARGLLLGE